MTKSPSILVIVVIVLFGHDVGWGWDVFELAYM